MPLEDLLGDPRHVLDDFLRRLTRQIDRNRDDGDGDQRDSAGAGELRAPPVQRHRQKSQAEDQPDDREVVQDEVKVRPVHVYVLPCSVRLCWRRLRRGTCSLPFVLGARRRPAGLQLGAQRLDLQLDDVGREQQVQRPVEGDAQPPLPARQRQQVVGAPGEPGQEPRQPDAEHLADAAVPTQSGEHAEPFVTEGSRCLSTEDRVDVLGHVPALANGVLRRGRLVPLSVAVGDERAVAYRPEGLIAAHLQERVDGQAVVSLDALGLHLRDER